MIKCGSKRKFKRYQRIMGSFARRWLKRPENGGKKERYLANKFSKAADKFFTLNYNYCEPEETTSTVS